MKTLAFLLFNLALVAASARAQATGPDAVPGTPNITHPPTFLGAQRGHLYADIETSKGLIEAELDFEHAPLTAMNFVGLAEGTLPFEGRPKATGFYDGTTFHRVVKDFVIQGGDPASADPAFPVDKLGDGGPGYSFPDEFSPRLRHDMAGVLSMANDGPDTNGSQFFITLRETNRLNYLHSVFGQVVRGMDVVNRIEQGDKIVRVTIRRGGEGDGAAATAARVDNPAEPHPADLAASPAPLSRAEGFRASPEAFAALKEAVLHARHPGPPEGFVPLVDDTKQLPDLRVKNFNYKLANYQRTTGHRIAVRLAPEFKPDAPGQTAANATKLVGGALHLPDNGDMALACFFAEGNLWSLRLGEETYPALIGEPGTTEQLIASGALRRGKEEILHAATDLTKAGKLKEGVDALLDTLILRLDDYTLKAAPPDK